MTEATSAEWRPVVGWEGFYEVSDAGEIRSLPRRSKRNDGHSHPGGMKKAAVFTNGYLGVSLCGGGKKDTRLVHAIVAEAFLGPRPAGHDVRHGSGGRFDNSAANLSYGSRAENEADKLRDGTSNAGSRNGHARLTENDVIAIRHEFASVCACGVVQGYQRALAARYNVSAKTISDIIRRNTWKHVALIPGHPY